MIVTDQEAQEGKFLAKIPNSKKLRKPYFVKFTTHENHLTFAIIYGRTCIYLLDFQVSCHLIYCTTEFTTIHLSGLVDLGFPKV